MGQDQRMATRGDPEGREAARDLWALLTLPIFVLPTTLWPVVLLARSSLGSSKVTPEGLVTGLLLFVAWAVVASFVSSALWLATMRFFLPANVLRRWALSGPRVPVLTRLTEKLCDRLLRP
jgi:hypothetical protein